MFCRKLNLGILNGPINVFCDNQSDILLIKIDTQSFKGKYIDISYYYIQDIVKRGKIKVNCILFEEMTTDPMTK